MTTSGGCWGSGSSRSAHVVGSALDRSGLDGVLGTVAGDDTLLLVTSHPDGGEEVSRRIEELAGLGGA